MKKRTLLVVPVEDYYVIKSYLGRADVPDNIVNSFNVSSNFRGEEEALLEARNLAHNINESYGHPVEVLRAVPHYKVPGDLDALKDVERKLKEVSQELNDLQKKLVEANKRVEDAFNKVVNLSVESG